MIKYKTGGYSKSLIEAVEVARETDSSVWVVKMIRTTKGVVPDERRYSKLSQYESYYDSWELARQALLKTAEDELVGVRRRLELAQAKVGNLKGMKPPKEIE